MKTVILVACIFCVLLTSCSSFIGKKLLHIRKGNSTAEVMTADKDLVENAPVNISGEGLDPKSNYVLLISELQAADNENYLIYGFKDNKLFYWGYPYQFMRSDDRETRIFGELATKYLVDHKYLKATKE